MHHASIYVHSNWGQSASIYQPTPLPSPTSYAARFMMEDHREPHSNWSEQEDELLLNRKLSFDEVNVLLASRSESEIWSRMVKLRENEMTHRQSMLPMHCMSEVRRESYEDRIPGIGSVAMSYHTASR